MSEAFSYERITSNPESSSSLSHESKTPPPLETALSYSDNYSPSAADSAESSPQASNPLSLSIPNPFLNSSSGDHQVPGFTGGIDSMDPTAGIGWHTDIQPAPVVVSSGFSPYSDTMTDGPEDNGQAGSYAPSNGNHPGGANLTTLGKVNSNTSVADVEDDELGGGKDRRQKRLERNRESARLSRRRRKQYLEVLEAKVTELSDEMDKGRRLHVSQALATIKLLRGNGLVGPNVARASAELRLAASFRSQQMQSLCAHSSTKFIFWLTLQNDVYFRGGRAASERLSAARIGERMLQNGNDKVTPAQSMWPLFCNEIALSYDQEERVRSFQKNLLAEKESWLDRHSAYASSLTIKSTHEAIQAIAFRVGHRERATDGVLGPGQRSKLSSFVSSHRAVLKERLATQPMNCGDYQTSKDQHVAANLYVSNHQLSSMLNKTPRAPPLLTPKAMKKLSRRPSFESLGVAPGDKKENEDVALSRERSFASSGSLKRSASEMSIDGEERAGSQMISPQESEAAAVAHVESVLGGLKQIIPVPSPAAPVIIHTVAQAKIPRPVASAPALSHASQPFAVLSNPVPAVSVYPQVQPPVVAAAPQEQQAQGQHNSKHQRKSSFLPAHLNVVPEEMWTADPAAEEFLMSLAEDDWAIGVDM